MVVRGDDYMIGFRWKWRRQDLFWILGCIIFFLALIIVALILILIKDKEGANEYFSFAVNISSILLAIVAIIYAFFQSKQSSQQSVMVQHTLTNIDKEVLKLASIKDDIVGLKKEQDSFKCLLDDIKISATNLKETTEAKTDNTETETKDIDMKDKIDSLINKVEILDNQYSDIYYNKKYNNLYRAINSSDTTGKIYDNFADYMTHRDKEKLKNVWNHELCEYCKKKLKEKE